MSLSFHNRSAIWLTAAALTLGLGIAAARSGHVHLQRAQAQGEEMRNAQKALQTNLDRTDAYARLIEHIGWRPGQDLRHESIDTTAVIADHESDRLNEILRANHVGKGQFFLRSLQIEALRSGPQAQPAVKVTVKGDNILVLDRP